MVMLNTLANANTIVKYPSCNRIINQVKDHALYGDIVKSLSSIEPGTDLSVNVILVKIIFLQSYHVLITRQ